MKVDDLELRGEREGEKKSPSVSGEDPHRGQSVYAHASREGIHQVDGPETDFIQLAAIPLQQRPEPVVLELQAQVTTQNPGVYVCQEIQAFDMLDQASTTPLNPPRR